MSRHFRKSFQNGRATALALILTAASPAAAATYNVTFSDFGSSTVGTFDAPLGGGTLTAFSALIGNTLFDTLALGAAAPVYNPILNPNTNLFDIEFRGFSQSTGIVYNSVASAQCPLGQCVLQLFDTVGGTASPEAQVLNTVTFQNLFVGFYSIDPVPLPAPVPLPSAVLLLGGALAGLGALGQRRRSRRPPKPGVGQDQFPGAEPENHARFPPDRSAQAPVPGGRP